jgi:hypothetical protein
MLFSTLFLSCPSLYKVTATTKALSVSGLPRGDKAPTRNDGYDHGNGNGKVENGIEGFCAFPQNDRHGNGILETATPHPALSRKGGGNDHD